MKSTLSGKYIDHIYGVPATSKNHKVGVFYDGNDYRIDVRVLKQIMGMFVFDVKVLNKYPHLISVNWDETKMLWTEINFPIDK